MRASVVTWNVQFSSAATETELEQAARVVGSDAAVARAPDSATIFREFGADSRLLIEPAKKRDAGELALHCLTVAHRLGRGWSIFWPSVPKPFEHRRTSEQEAFAALPESLNGLHGWCAEPMLKNAAVVSFSVEVLEEAAEPKQRAADPPSCRAASTPGTLTPDALEVMTALMGLIVKYRTIPWDWTAADARRQLEQLGFAAIEDLCDEILFRSAAGETARIVTDGAAVRWIEFIAASQAEIHLLDELAREDVCRKFETLFYAGVRTLESLLGTPGFHGASGDPGYPSEQWADWAAVWPQSSARIMLQQKHNDKELPIELTLVFAPL